MDPGSPFGSWNFILNGSKRFAHLPGWLLGQFWAYWHGNFIGLLGVLFRMSGFWV